MASLSGVTDQLQRQNQMELAAVVRLANEQLTSSGARQGLDEITKIFEAQQGTSLKEFKATKLQINHMQKELAKLDGVNTAEKRVLEQVLKSSQASISENVTFKKSIGEMASNTVEQSIDSIGGTIAGSLSGSPLLAFGASFIGDRFAQFKENKRAAKEAQAEREDKIAQEAALEEREFALLRDQMDNEKVARLSGKTQSEIDALSLEQLEQEKNIIIQKAKAAKQEADLQEEERKNIEDVQARFGLDSEESSGPVTPSAPSTTTETESAGGSNIDLTRTNELLENIDSRLHGSPDYLEILNDKIDILIKDDPTSLEIENERELKRHQKKLEENGRAQIQATSSAAALAGGSGEGGSGGFIKDFAKEIAATVLGVGGLSAGVWAKNKLFPSKTPTVEVDTPDGRTKAAAKSVPEKSINPDKPTAKTSRLKRFFSSMEKIPKVGPLIKGAVALGTAVTVADVVSDVASSTGATKPTSPDPVVTGRPAPQIAPNKPSLLSRTKTAIVNKTPFKTLSADTPTNSPATVGRGPDGKFVSLQPKSVTVPEVTKPPKTTPAKTGGLDGAKKAMENLTAPIVKLKDGAKKSVAGAVDKTIAKKILATKGAKMVAKAVPAVGIAAGGLFALNALFKGDFVGAGLEVGGMFLPSVSGIPLDAGIMARETYNEMYKTDKDEFPLENDMITNPDLAMGRMSELKDMALDAIGIGQKEIDKNSLKQEEKVEPRPTMWPMDRSGNILKRKQKEWDDMYGESHNKEGSPKIPEKSESGTKGSITKPISTDDEDVPIISKGVDTGIRIAGAPFMGPEVPLSPMQRAAVDTSISMGNQVSPDIQSAYDLGKVSVTPSDNKLNTNLAASETIKTSALEKSTAGQTNNVVASGNTNNTAVNTTNNNVTQRVPSRGVRNPEQTATQMRQTYALNNF